MKILITGATGLLGGRFYHILGENHDAIGTYSSNSKEGLHHMPLLDKTSIDSLISELKPEAVIHTAGIADLDFCEQNKEIAYAVNKTGTGYLVDACKKNSTIFVFISSSSIFSNAKQANGKETPNPPNYYGQTKLEAEEYVKKNIKDWIILRPTKVYGYSEDKYDFTRKIVKSFKDKGRVEVDNHLKYYPVLNDNLAEFVSILLDSGLTGAYNICSSKPYTKFEWARLISRVFNLNGDKIKSIEEKVVASRPIDLSFSIEKIQRLNFNPTSLEEGTARVKEQMGYSSFRGPEHD